MFCYSCRFVVVVVTSSSSFFFFSISLKGDFQTITLLRNCSLSLLLLLLLSIVIVIISFFFLSFPLFPRFQTCSPSAPSLADLRFHRVYACTFGTYIKFPLLKWRLLRVCRGHSLRPCTFSRLRTREILAGPPTPDDTCVRGPRRLSSLFSRFYQTLGLAGKSMTRRVTTRITSPR